MAMMKQLYQFNEEFQNLYDSWQHFYNQMQTDNPDQMTLDDHSIPDEQELTNPISFDAIQGHLVEKARDGFGSDIRDLIVAHGANKLSDIPAKDYPKLWQEVDALGK